MGWCHGWDRIGMRYGWNGKKDGEMYEYGWDEDMYGIWMDGDRDRMGLGWGSGWIWMG